MLYIVCYYYSDICIMICSLPWAFTTLPTNMSTHDSPVGSWRSRCRGGALRNIRVHVGKHVLAALASLSRRQHVRQDVRKYVHEHVREHVRYQT